MNLDNPISINEIKNWLQENNSNFHNSIEKTPCRKWSKWLNDNSTHLYPCVCPIRNEDCIFAETYYKFSNVLEISKMEERCEIELTIYQQIRHNKLAVFEWMKANKELLEKIIYFSTTIKINSNPEKPKVLRLKPHEFENILKLQKVFTENYFSGDFQNY